ncbi:MAG TPA: SGNH/GDSL hydrolase family protein [Nitrospira sp.]|nr:SGNH/GDSL hydrolase family protein [Nitrospira sp.]
MIILLLFLALFSVAELAYRVRVDGGVKKATRNLLGYVRDVPYSNLGTGHWVIYDDQLGYRLNPNRSGINSLSVRHGEIINPKPPGKYRVLVLGDSIPWDKLGFVDYLTELLSKEADIEVINAAVPGYTAYQEVIFFKSYLQQSEPDLVIWTYCLNDNHKFLHRFDEQAKMLWTNEAIESLTPTSSLTKLVSRSYILSELRLRISTIATIQQACRFPWECVPDFNIAWKDEPWTQYEAYLVEMERLIEQIHSRLSIVIFPYEPQLEQHGRVQDQSIEYLSKPQRQMNALCRKYDVLCMDLFPAFQEKYGNGIKLFRDGIHLNKEGHELTGALIYTFLREKDLVPVSR